MKSLIDKLYEPEKYGVVEIVVGIQALIDERDVWKKACELASEGDEKFPASVMAQGAYLRAKQIIEEENKKQIQIPDTATAAGLRLMGIIDAAASVALDKDPDCHTCHDSCTEFEGCPGRKKT